MVLEGGGSPAVIPPVLAHLDSGPPGSQFTCWCGSHTQREQTDGTRKEEQLPPVPASPPAAPWSSSVIRFFLLQTEPTCRLSPGLFRGCLHAVRLHQPGVAQGADCPWWCSSLAGAESTSSGTQWPRPCEPGQSFTSGAAAATALVYVTAPGSVTRT